MNILVLDTETIGLSDPRIYNLGYCIYDTEAHAILLKRDYVIRQVFGNAKLMAKAFYADRIPLYKERIKNGTCKKIFWGNACRVLANDIKKYNVRAMYAFNSRFDKRSITYTCKCYKNKLNPTAHGIIDIMQEIKCITDTQEYRAFCEANGFMTKHKKPRCQRKAETLYRFLTGQVNYNEEHTALADSLIELVIHNVAQGATC